MQKKFNTVIIGGGAAGLISAVELVSGNDALNGNGIVILERNDRVGKKLIATGNGQGNLMNKNMSSRREKQPLEYPNAGSTFKRPAGHFAGKLIEDAELKGYTVGGAQVSEKHAGFLINRGGATSRDVLELIEHIQNIVKEKYGVDLESEIIYIPY